MDVRHLRIRRVFFAHGDMTSYARIWLTSEDSPGSIKEASRWLIDPKGTSIPNRRGRKEYMCIRISNVRNQLMKKLDSIRPAA